MEMPTIGGLSLEFGNGRLRQLHTVFIEFYQFALHRHFVFQRAVMFSDLLFFITGGV